MAHESRKAAINSVVATLTALPALEHPDLASPQPRVVIKGLPLRLVAGIVSIVTGYGMQTQTPVRDRIKGDQAQISVVDAIKIDPNNPALVEDLLADMVTQTQQALDELGLIAITSSPEDQEDMDGVYYRAERTVALVPHFKTVSQT